MKCNPTHLLLLVDVGFPCFNPTYNFTSDFFRKIW
jgi:hypothetical protein